MNRKGGRSEGSQGARLTRVSDLPTFRTSCSTLSLSLSRASLPPCSRPSSTSTASSWTASPSTSPPSTTSSARRASRWTEREYLERYLSLDDAGVFRAGALARPAGRCARRRCARSSRRSTRASSPASGRRLPRLPGRRRPARGSRASRGPRRHRVGRPVRGDHLRPRAAWACATPSASSSAPSTRPPPSPIPAPYRLGAGRKLRRLGHDGGVVVLEDSGGRRGVSAKNGGPALRGRDAFLHARRASPPPGPTPSSPISSRWTDALLEGLTRARRRPPSQLGPSPRSSPSPPPAPTRGGCAELGGIRGMTVGAHRERLPPGRRLRLARAYGRTLAEARRDGRHVGRRHAVRPRVGPLGARASTSPSRRPSADNRVAVARAVRDGARARAARHGRAAPVGRVGGVARARRPEDGRRLGALGPRATSASSSRGRRVAEATLRRHVLGRRGAPVVGDDVARPELRPASSARCAASYSGVLTYSANWDDVERHR